MTHCRFFAKGDTTTLGRRVVERLSPRPYRLRYQEERFLFPSFRLYFPLSLSSPAVASFFRAGPVSQVPRCRRPVLSHLMRLTCSFKKNKNKNKRAVGGGGGWGRCEIAPANTATLILCTQDLCLLQSLRRRFLPRLAATPRITLRGRSLSCVVSGQHTQRVRS